MRSADGARAYAKELSMECQQLPQPKFRLALYGETKELPCDSSRTKATPTKSSIR